jgi:hypothetical protein
MRSMPSSIGPVHSLNSGLSRRESVHLHDEDEAAILGDVLVKHPAFLAKADRLATIADINERARAADQEARAYAPKSGPRRDLVVRFLLRASECPPSVRSTIIANVNRTAFWADDERPSELRRQRIRGRVETLRDGARRFARAGAGECVECGAPLPDLYERVGASRRRRRRSYCAKHEAAATHWGGVHEQQVRSSVEAATGQHRRRLQRRHGTSLS